MSPIINFVCDYCGNTGARGIPKFTQRLGIQDTKFKVVRCEHCGLDRLHPLPNEEDFKKHYEGYVSKKNRIEVENIRLEKIYPQKLKKLSVYSQGNKLLDIGAGLGTFVYAAEQESFEATGIEFEEEQCIWARENRGVDLIHGKIEDLYQTLGKFDVIHSHHVLEHVHSPKEVIDIIIKLLKPGGICMIEVPNQFFNLKKNILSKIWPDKYSTEVLHSLDHIHFFSYKTFKRYFVRDKVDILEISQFRDEVYEASNPKGLLKKTYRYITDKFEISSNHFFEIVFRKKV